MGTRVPQTPGSHAVEPGHVPRKDLPASGSSVRSRGCWRGMGEHGERHGGLRAESSSVFSLRELCSYYGSSGW